MPDFYTCVNLLINKSEEIGEKQLSAFDSEGGQISPLMHVALSLTYYLFVPWRGRIMVEQSFRL